MSQDCFHDCVTIWLLHLIKYKCTLATGWEFSIILCNYKLYVNNHWVFIRTPISLSLSLLCRGTSIRPKFSILPKSLKYPCSNNIKALNRVSRVSLLLPDPGIKVVRDQIYFYSLWIEFQSIADLPNALFTRVLVSLVHLGWKGRDSLRIRVLPKNNIITPARS